MRRLKEWRWALVASLMINGYIPARFTFAESFCVIVFLWLTILFGIYWVEERIEHGREV
jgi:hypothetical protein